MNAKSEKRNILTHLYQQSKTGFRVALFSNSQKAKGKNYADKFTSFVVIIMIYIYKQ